MAAWDIQVILDADSNDVGTVIATWTETAPTIGTFVYSSRAKKDLAGANAFIASAIAARNFWQTKKAANETAAATLKTMINTADPKAV